MKKDQNYVKPFKIQAEKAIDITILEAIPFDYPGSDTEIVYETDEFTSLCPWSGLPDFGSITIIYVPDKKLVELKSLKYYLMSYRYVGILQEHTVNHILKDLVKLIEPLSMTVEADFKERGGIWTKATANYKR